jgi:ABC-type antimicrobial peptide transport system permease subunit
MGLLFQYSIRNLATRRLTTLLTVLGMALVVFVFAAVLMLAHGLEKTLVDTGSEENIFVTRDASTAETVSILDRDQAGIVMAQPEIAVEGDGTPIATKEIVVLIAAEKRSNSDEANVVIRGTEEEVFRLRKGIRLVKGRMFAPGTSELIAGASTARNFKNCGLGERLRFAEREWAVVGVFDGGGTGFDSELWGDAEQVQQAFRRPIYSSVTARLRDKGSFEEMEKRLEADPRLTVEVEREIEYYAKQSRATATFIRVIGLVVTIIFSIGAVLGAMITMYAAVSNRTSEIGTLRAIGFTRRTVLAVFLVEALALGLLGGAAGIAGASFLSFITVSTTNWDTFSEIAFGFELSPDIVIGSFLFAIVMGVVGGFLPAVRASRARIVESLRAA